MPPGHDDRLPDIERSGGAQIIEPEGDVVAIRSRRLQSARACPFGTRISGATSCAPSKTEPLLLEQLRHAAKKVVVAAAKGGCDPRQRVSASRQSNRIRQNAGRTSEPIKHDVAAVRAAQRALQRQELHGANDQVCGRLR